MIAKVAGRIRGLFSGNYPENDEQILSMTNRGDLVVTQGLPELTEVVRLGKSWQAITSTGQAALTAAPSTTSGASLINSEPANGVCYVIDSFGSVEEVVDATQTDVTAVFAMVNLRISSAPSAGTVETTNSQVRSLIARSSYDGNAVLRRGATVVNDVWFPHGTPGAQMAAAVAGANWKVNECAVRGLYLIPPGGAFNWIAVKAAAAAASQQFYFVRWHEVQLIYKT